MIWETARCVLELTVLAECWESRLVRWAGLEFLELCSGMALLHQLLLGVKQGPADALRSLIGVRWESKTLMSFIT